MAKKSCFAGAALCILPTENLRVQNLFLHPRKTGKNAQKALCCPVRAPGRVRRGAFLFCRYIQCVHHIWDITSETHTIFSNIAYCIGAGNGLYYKRTLTATWDKAPANKPPAPAARKGPQGPRRPPCTPPAVRQDPRQDQRYDQPKGERGNIHENHQTQWL